MHQAQFLQLARTNARRQGEKSREEALGLTNHAQAAKYEPVIQPLRECADLLERIGSRLDTLSEPTKEPPP
jgi:hypothetical protein